MPTESYPERTKKNIRESDGTLILSHGRLTGGSEYIEKWALEYGKPMIHIDLNNTEPWKAAAIIGVWVSKHEIGIINIAGSRASKDSKIYDATIDIIESVYVLNHIEHDMKTSLRATNRWKNEQYVDMPKTVDKVVDKIVGDLDFKTKTALAKLTEDSLVPIQLSLGIYIKERLINWYINKELEKACIQACREEGIDESNPQIVIIKRIWERLKKTHKLRVVE
jgi:hypothetical protein